MFLNIAVSGFSVKKHAMLYRVTTTIKQTRCIARACFIWLCCVVYFLPLPPDDLPLPFAVLLLRPPPDLLPVVDGLFCG